MSSYADFKLAGIIRDVSVFAVPATHVERMQVSTHFDSDYRNATLRIDLTLVNESNRRSSCGEISWELRSSEGVAVPASIAPVRFSLPPWGRWETKGKIPVESPQHREAEHPHLYRLVFHLTENGKETEQVARRVARQYASKLRDQSRPRYAAVMSRQMLADSHIPLSSGLLVWVEPTSRHVRYVPLTRSSRMRRMSSCMGTAPRSR